MVRMDEIIFRVPLMYVQMGEKASPDIILAFLLLIPLFAVLLWSYFYQKDSILWGKKWLYKEEREIPYSAIRYMKVISLVSVVVFTLIIGNGENLVPTDDWIKAKVEAIEKLKNNFFH